MKFVILVGIVVQAVVAPFTGAWIEINVENIELSTFLVAPFTGAWIEIFQPYKQGSCFHVAPFTGAWIEMVKE